MSIKTQYCLAMSHTGTKRATTKFSRIGQEDGEVLPKESVTPDGRPMVCQEDNLSPSLRVTLCQVTVGPEEKLSLCQERHGYENNFVSRDTVAKEVVSSWHCVNRWHFPRSHSNAKWATKSLTKKLCQRDVGWYFAKKASFEVSEYVKMTPCHQDVGDFLPWDTLMQLLMYEK